MKKTLKQTKGITLIALIITIIVLLILAVVTISIMSNQGLLSRAENSVNLYDDAATKEKIALAYQEYKIAHAEGGAELTLKQALQNQGLEVKEVEETEEGYEIIVTTKNGDKTYTLSKEGNIASVGERWTQSGDTITLGDTALKVGDYVKYENDKDASGKAVTTEYASKATTTGYSTDQIFKASTYTGGWKVLGVKGGKIQLISAEPIQPDEGGKSNSTGNYCLKGQNGYVNGVSELNKIAAIYGKGKGATGARSITVEDINKITGYDPANTGTGKPCDDDQIYAYGNEVTYYWKGDDKPYYVGSNGVTGSLSSSHSRFTWYDGSHWQSSPKSTTASNTEEGRERIATIKCTRYYYYPNTLTTSSGGTTKGIETSSNEYKTLFGKYYWLASPYVGTYTGSVSFGMRCVYSSHVDHHSLYNSIGDTGDPSYGVRPVVSLSSDIQVTKDAEHDGSTLEKACTLN